MLRATLWGLRSKASAAAPTAAKGSLRALRRQLADLKSANAAATAWRVERRRLASLLQRHRWEQQQQQQQQQQAREGSTCAGNAEAGPSTASDAARAQMSAAERELHAEAVRLLPRNEELESAIAFTLRENRDARTELEFTRHLLNSTLLSLASPVGPWDPYDVKPQVFALDTYMALPVFTSIEYLELFCRHFGFTTRDPSGVLWVDGQAGHAGDGGGGAARPQLTAPDSVSQSMWWEKESRQHPPSPSPAAEEAETGGETRPKETETVFEPDGVKDEEASAVMDAAGLFDDLADTTPLVPPTVPHASPASAPTKAGKKATKRQKRKKKMGSTGLRGDRKSRRAKKNKKASAQEKQAAEARQKEAAEANRKAKEAFWRSVAAVSPFHLKQATPLPVFGRFVYPFFIGYFADINTLLHNASIVPDKVDIVLNPLSPTEFVLAREATDRVLHRDQLLLLAYQRVERELQRELSAFFARYCPEVRHARSACVPRPLDMDAAVAAVEASRGFSGAANPLQDQRTRTRVLRESEFTGGVAYEVAILIRSEDLPATYRCVQWGKEKCLLMGHPDLDLLPEDAAAPHVAEVAQVFYVAEAERNAHASAHESSARKNTADKASDGGGDSQASGERARGALGVFRKLGDSQTVSVAQSADSYFHDPTNAYTESHAVFTEELKLKRGQ